MDPQEHSSTADEGKEKPIANSRAAPGHEEFALGRRLYHSPTAALLPRWKGLIYLHVLPYLRGHE